MIEIRTGIFLVSFMIPGSFSLKDKRQVMRRILGKARGSRKGFNISISEVAFQNSYRKSVVAASIVSDNKDFIHKNFNVLTRFFESFSEISIHGINTEVLPMNYTMEDMVEEKYGC